VSFNIHDSDGNVLDHEQKQTNGLTADASGQTDAYADQLYDINAGHYILPTYYVYNYYYQGQYRNGWYDYYNYTGVEGQNTVPYDCWTYPGYGPVAIVQYTTDIILGQTKKTVKVGTPDHLWIEEDTFDASPYCTAGSGAISRTIFYKLVDVNNKGVGKASMVEEPASVVDSCTGANVVTTSTCSPVVASNSLFPDTFLVGGCPPSDCGFDLNPQLWKWCPKNGTPVTMAKIIVHVRPTQITVNGKPDRYGTGTRFYADGSVKLPGQ
jgi:hypothetical protein